MQFNYFHAGLCFFILLLTGCGGSDSAAPPVQDPPGDEVVEEEEKESNFALTLHTEGECGSAPLTNTRIHLYNESPVVRPDQSYTEYFTNEAGMLELDLADAETVSFSIIAENNRGYKVYTMNEVAVGRYDMTVLFAGESDIGGDCQCQDKTVSAVDSLSYGIFQDSSLIDELIWGRGAVNVRAKSSIGVNELAYEVEVCGDAFDTMPQLLTFRGAPGQDLYYGFNTAEDAKNDTPIDVRHIAEVVAKPAKGFDYAVVLSKNIKQRTYTYQTAMENDTSFLTFPEFNVGKVTARLINVISGSYNNAEGPMPGNTVFERDIVNILPDEDITGMPEFLLGTTLNVSLNMADKEVSIDHDFDSEFNQLLVNQKYWLDGRVLNWYIYSPEKSLVVLPNLIDDIKPFLEEGQLWLSYVNLKNIENASSYTDTLVKQRFNYFNEDGERIDNPDLDVRSIRLQHLDRLPTSTQVEAFNSSHVVE